jgi:hypothetical protein
MNEQNPELEVVSNNAVAMLQRGEMDSQIDTAKRYPRSIEKFKRQAIALATIDEETAESCIYRREVGKKNGVAEFAEGMSVRMAEIVRVYAMVIFSDERKVTARGMAIDLENNFASSSEVSTSTVTRDGQPYNERMRLVVAAATLAKARRDATFQVVPRALAKPVETAVRKMLTGDSKTLDSRRARAIAWINKLGILQERVYAALEIKGPAELDAEKLEELTGIRTAIKEGDVAIDDAFPPLEPKVAEAPAEKPGKESATPKPAAESQPEKPKPTPGFELQTVVESAGADFEIFRKWLGDSGNHDDPSSLGSYDELPADLTTRLLRAKALLSKSLAKMVAGGKS